VVKVARPPGALGPIAGEIVDRCLVRALEQWEGACALRFEVVEAARGANIVLHFGAIDGPGQTLAQSYLPCGATATTLLAQQYDPAEAWTEEMLYLCMIHELGHAIGLGHSPNPASIMYPTLHLIHSGLGEGDAAAAAALYPGAAPPVPTPAPPAAEVEIEIPAAGRYRLTRIS